MAKQCRHIHHEVEPQKNIWNGGEFKKVQPGQVYCASPPQGCGLWLYEKPINWDLVPKNTRERREMKIDESRASERTATPAGQLGAVRRADAG